MRLLAVLIVCLLVSYDARGDWSAGLGYHNPPGATVGLNLMDLWTNWAIEIGVGYIGSSENWNSKNNVYSVGGDLGLKYLFRSGDVFRPFFVGGISDGLATSTAGTVSAGASLTNPFGGAGFYLMGKEFYFYASYLILNAGEVQAGIGFPF